MTKHEMKTKEYMARQRKSKSAHMKRLWDGLAKREAIQWDKQVKAQTPSKPLQ